MPAVFIEKEKQMYDYTQDNLTVSSNCYACTLLDSVCQECEDSKEARDAQIAHEIVDEGNLQYKRQWMIVTEPSNHDWTHKDGEYKPPIVMLQDGGVYEELWELEDYVQSARETVCPWCRLTTPKMFNECQDCDKPLESNVR